MEKQKYTLEMVATTRIGLHSDIDTILAHLQEELAEYDQAMKGGDYPQAALEVVDVVNFAVELIDFLVARHGLTIERVAHAALVKTLLRKHCGKNPVAEQLLLTRILRGE